MTVGSMNGFADGWGRIKGNPTAIASGGQLCCPPSDSCDFTVAVEKPVITQCSLDHQWCNTGPYAKDYCSPLGAPGTIAVAIGPGQFQGICEGSNGIGSPYDPPAGPSPFGCDYWPSSITYKVEFSTTGQCAKTAKIGITVLAIITQAKIPPDTFQNFQMSYRWFGNFVGHPQVGNNYDVPFDGNDYECPTSGNPHVNCYVATDPLTVEFV